MPGRSRIWALFALVGNLHLIQAALYLSPPAGVDAPRLTVENRVRSFPRLAAGSSTTLLTWSERSSGPGSHTNTVAVAIDQNGHMRDPGGVLAAAHMFGYPLVDILAVGGDFVIVHGRRSAALGGNVDYVFVRLDSTGRPVTQPKVLATNAVRISSASNGRTHLHAWGDAQNALHVALFDSDGGLIKMANIPAQIAVDSSWMRTAGAGSSYLVVWPEAGVQAASITADGVITTKSISTRRLELRALASNGDEYLLAGYEATTALTRLYLLDRDGAVLAEGATTNNTVYSGVTIIADAERWHVFQSRRYRYLDSYSVQRDGARLTVGLGPLPRIEGDAIQRFHGDRYIVTGMIGARVAYRIVSASEQSDWQFPLARVRQSHTVVGVSSEGYMIAWQEADIVARVLARRFRRDGTAVDAQPFELAGCSVNGVIRINHEQGIYRVVWISTVGGLMAVSVDPDGLPNVRLARAAVEHFGWTDDSLLEMTPYRDTSLVYQRQRLRTIQSYEPARSGTPFVQGRVAFAGRGDELFKVVDYGGWLTAGRSAGVFEPLMETHNFGAGSQALAVATTNRYLAAWRGTYGALEGALIENGTVVQRNQLLPSRPFTNEFSAAGSANKALLSALWTTNPFILTNTLLVVDGQTGSTEALERTIEFGTNAVISVAAFGRDFLVASTLWDGATTYAAVQTLSETPPPVLAATTGSDGLRLDLSGLNSDRRYNIQRSLDFESWEAVADIAGMESHQFVGAFAPGLQFFRIVLLPD